MKTVQFKDVPVDSNFKMNDTEYKKIQEERVSCCRFNNACLASDANQKTGIKPLTEVQVDD
jgi:hypothetical protein